MTLALLRASLNGSSERSALENINFFIGASAKDWSNCAKFCAAQGVLSLGWDAVKLLPQELRPPKTLLIQWGLSAQKQEERFEAQLAALKSLAQFYSAHGLQLILLKGAGFASLYPQPSHRESGDLDIYVVPAEGSDLTLAQAHRLADDLIIKRGIAVDNPHVGKHSEFEWEGVSVENHRLFLEEAGPELHKLLAELVVADATEVVLEAPEAGLEVAPEATVVLEVGTTGKTALGASSKGISLGPNVALPSAAFQSLFCACHAAHHYCAGLVLRHLCDWAVLLNNGAVIYPEGLDAGMREWMDTLNYLCGQHFGCDVTGLSTSSTHADEVLEEILHQKYSYAVVPVQGGLRVLLYKFRRALYRYSRTRWIFSESFGTRIRRSLSFHLHNPHQLFNRKMR